MKKNVGETKQLFIMLCFVYFVFSKTYLVSCLYRRYFQHAHFIPIVGAGKRGAY